MDRLSYGEKKYKNGEQAENADKGLFIRSHFW